MPVKVLHLGDTPDGEAVIAISGLEPCQPYVVTVTFPSHDPSARGDACTEVPGMRVITPSDAEERARVRQLHYAKASDGHGILQISYPILEDGDVVVDCLPAAEPEQPRSVIKPVARTGRARVSLGKVPE